ncbi:hypothetical protein QVD17_17956 [Tagetes erecta]|uniref:Gnk2-homologous domain-containing protein n=1 Tax=Tagetes erecta TaxID=13708 RepID=A0AAD8NNI1_TARER|nr:hypothetical protein QVD17_17956 [Tagetes erecta]
MNTLMKTRSKILFLFLILLNVVSISMSEPVFYDIFRCKTDSGTFQANSPYKTSLMSALNSLAGETDKHHGFASKFIGNKTDEVHAVALCPGYLKPKDCASCVNNTIPLLLKKCPNQKGAAAWRFKCMVRYTAPVVNNYDLWFVAHEVSDIKAKNVTMLEKALSMLEGDLLRVLYRNDPRAYAFNSLGYGDQRIYMVMQCTPDILSDNCMKCLLHISREKKPCCNGAIAAAMLTPNCYLRYAHADFRIL